MRLGLVHGRLRADEKDDVMRRFAAGGLDVLISTTVIEVGVDVPNATVMVVEHAERFGLAQLHQLRGRVGRGGHQSYCVMLYQTPLTDEARARLETIAQTDDGFVIAERDLELRGPGDVFGTRQSGMPKLRIGDISRDRAVMESAREAAVAYVRDAPVDDPLIAETRATWAERFGLVGIG
jgi:ATP-dependent DNA helicase RecG